MGEEVELFESEWLEEAEDRLAAYISGEIRAVDAEQVFKDVGKKIYTAKR